MKVEDCVRIVEGPPIGGVSAHHVEIFEPSDESWHSIRACLDKADAVRVHGHIERLLNRVSRKGGLDRKK